jgi:hypothetical protein
MRAHAGEGAAIRSSLDSCKRWSTRYQPPPPPPPPPPPDEPPPDELLLPELELEPDEGLGGGVEALAAAEARAPLKALGEVKRLLWRYHSGR